MIRHLYDETINYVGETGLVTLFYNLDLSTCVQVLRSCYTAGIRIFEFANRGENAYTLFVALRR
ncbi:hypothetical protein [Siphonobacter sp. SORGH_AS_0500]|uniref:hypothetical protein n=1 Tax=Siphonobacter sp. SORGH_AS_0500 TaxID=1864824 RepID=UPI00285A917A|nr:hypothetical protein [Siphonobacter sp. SORGH_AS_0500]MDR6198085.1 2-keto-3-deoxy-6-phosphogluconate aldolase [Siphonobacter sp. SORGH_AS_0500]